MEPITWEHSFMLAAILASHRSKDPNTKVGAVVVSPENRIVGSGYNGFPNGIHDKDLPWARKGSFLETKYPFVVHAEANAIFNSPSTDLRGHSMYCVMYPCNECAKAIIQCGIRELVFLTDPYKDTDPHKATAVMFRLAGVRNMQMTDLQLPHTLDLHVTAGA